MGGPGKKYPKLVVQKTRAIGAVDLRAELAFLKPVFHNIAPGAADGLVEMSQRGLEIGDHEALAVLGFAAKMGGHSRHDGRSTLMWPTPGLCKVHSTYQLTRLLPCVEIRLSGDNFQSFQNSQYTPCEFRVRSIHIVLHTGL